MKRLGTGLLMFLLAFVLLAGCGQTDETENETADQEEPAQTENEDTTTDSSGQDQAANTETEESATITITEAGEEMIAEQEVPVEEGDILLDVMTENFEVEVTEDGFITSIEGVSQNEEEGKYWLYEVNGEPAEVGAAQYEVEPDDEVHFDLQAVE